jgi:hypothetical protein
MKENWEIHWKDYYKILQVHPLAEQAVIEVAFRKLASIYHPDHNKRLDADQQMKDLIEAHDILGNPLKRTVYDAKYNQKDILIHPTPKPEVKVNPNTTHGATQSRWDNITQSIWCENCQRKTDMRIAFVDKKPKYGLCPICKIYWQITDNLTPNEKLSLLFFRASNDKNIHFNRREWVIKRDEVIDELKPYGGDYILEICPKCNLGTLLLKSNARVGRCINPECSYRK